MASLRERGGWLAAGLAGVGLVFFHLLWGDLNQDEGWYLYAANLVRKGFWPYRDFAFTQGPLWPFVYSLFVPVVDQWGVTGGRVVTALLGGAATLLSARLAARLSKDSSAASAAAFATFCLALLNPVQAYFMSVVKTYALCGLLLTGGVAVFPRPVEPRRAFRAFAALFFLTAAAAVRLSAVAAVGAALAVLFWKRREYGGAFRAGCLGVAVGAGALFIPFYLAAPEGFRFGLFAYHAGRVTGGVGASLLLKAGFASRVVQSFYLVLLLGGSAWWVLRKEARRGEEALDPCRMVVGLSVAGMTVIHAMAPFPYDDYQVPVFPLAAALAAALAASFASWRAYLRPIVLAAALLAAISSPLNQEWMVRERDRIWWRMKDRPPLAVLREAARAVERLDPGGTMLLTQDLYLAVESRRTVPAGLELGPFCIFPGLKESEAAVRRVLTPAGLERLLREGPAPVAAFSGYGLAIAAPEIAELSSEDRRKLEEALRSRYRLAGEIPRFGQAGTALTLWLRLGEQEPSYGRRPDED